MAEVDPQGTYRVAQEHMNFMGSTLLRKQEDVRGALSTRDVQTGLTKEELLRLLEMGLTTRQCAEKLGRNIATVRKFMRHEDFQAELQKKNAALWARIDEELAWDMLSNQQKILQASSAALDRMRSLIDSEDESIALRASSDILDRSAETSKKSVGVQTQFQVQINPEQLALAVQAARELEAGNVILDGDSTPTPA